MAQGPTALLARFRALFGVSTTGVGHSFAALALSALSALVAGVALGTLEETLNRFPGLLVLVPAAIAARGNVFGALGARLGTSIHAGTFTLSRRLDTFVGQNIAASMVLTVGISTVLAFLAAGVSVAFGLPSVSLVDYIVISVGGGVLASIVVLVITLALAAGSLRFGWDLDNVTAPLVTATGDLVTVPALLAATYLAGRSVATPVLAAVILVITVLLVLWAWKLDLDLLRRILVESAPVLCVAGLLSLVAGVFFEKRLATLSEFETLFVLIPGYLGSAGALGGILSNRLSTKMLLGLAPPSSLPSRQVREDFISIAVLALPIFALNGLFSHASTLFGITSPGWLQMLGVAVLGGLAATAFVTVVAYYATVTAVRFGLDPDTYGIPMVTSALDVVGAFTFILALLALGIA